MSFGYNKQFKKDESVTKLKSLQELKDTQLKTRQLENDKKKMEERLQELRMAMEIEKEERSKRSPGGAIWSNGAEGPVTNHVQTVLNQNSAPDLSKVKKIVTLKDEPASSPSSIGSSRSAVTSRPPPGTMAHIASRSAIPHPKVVAAASQQNSTSPSCGQCETQLATMHCRECGENFCRGCFASFHVRGAFRGHHPMAISSTPQSSKLDIPLQPRIAFDSSSPGVAKPPNGEKTAIKKVKFTSDSPQVSERSERMFNVERSVAAALQTDDDMVISSQTSGSTSYDDHSVTNSFMDEWTSAVNAVASQLVGQAQATSSATSPGPKRVPSVTNRQVVSTTATGTSTDAGSIHQPMEQPITEIQFTFTGISYKDRLLINKHRRFELPPPNLPLVPKPPPVPSAGTRRVRQSKEGALSTSTRLSVDTTAESLIMPDPLDFDDVDREIKQINTDGILLVNGRPGSGVLFGSARWKHALEIELADDEMMLQTIAKQTKNENGLDTSIKIMSYDADLIDEIVAIADLSEIVESARTQNFVPQKKEPVENGENGNGESTALDLNQRSPSPADTITLKSRPNSSRPVSAKKVKPAPDQLRKILAKSRAQLSSEYGAHQLSTQPSKDLKQVVSSLADKPALKAVTSTTTEPSRISDFLLMGVESNATTQGSKTPRTPRPGSAAAKQPTTTTTATTISVYKMSPATWKPFSSVSVEDASNKLEENENENRNNDASIKEITSPPVTASRNNMPRASSPAIQVIYKLRFPEGQRSASKETDEEKDDIDKNCVEPERKNDEQERNSQLGLTMSLGNDEDEDTTPRNSSDGPSGFLGRVAHATDLRIESASSPHRVPSNSHRVPFSTAIGRPAAVAVPSPRPSSASLRASLKQSGYAQPRTPLQQSIEAWRATSRQEQSTPDISNNNNSTPSSSGEDDDDENDESETAGFVGRLATTNNNNNNALSSARSAGGSKSQQAIRPSDVRGSSSSQQITPRPRSSSAVPAFASSSQATVDDGDDDGEEEKEEEAETLRSLTEELKIEVSRSRDASLLQEEESDLQIPMVSSKMPTEFVEDQMHIIEDEQQNSFLNEDDFDDKMALAELASELHIASANPTTYPRIAGLSGNRASGSGSLANLLHGSMARESQAATSITSVTSYWTSSPSNSSSFTDAAKAGAGVANSNNLSVVAEDVDGGGGATGPTTSALSPQPPPNGSAKRGGGMVFNAHASHSSKGDFAIRQSSLMDDFDDVEKRLGENNQSLDQVQLDDDDDGY